MQLITPQTMESPAAATVAALHTRHPRPRHHLGVQPGPGRERGRPDQHRALSRRLLSRAFKPPPHRGACDRHRITTPHSRPPAERRAHSMAAPPGKGRPQADSRQPLAHGRSLEGTGAQHRRPSLRSCGPVSRQRVPDDCSIASEPAWAPPHHAPPPSGSKDRAGLRFPLAHLSVRRSPCSRHGAGRPGGVPRPPW
jgi:hypothetical protein